MSAGEREIVELLATTVMGWIREPEPDGDWYEQPYDGSGQPIEYGDWNPLTNPADCKQVREKLAERFNNWELENVLFGPMPSDSTTPCFRFQVWVMVADNDGWSTKETYFAIADTEERAVALCALKAAGVEL